jgi:hypothetical protein
MTQISSNLVKFVQTTNSINGVSFASLRGYFSSTTHETANYLVNLGASLKNAKAKDLAELKKIHLYDFYQKNIVPRNNPQFTYELLQEAFITVYNSLIENGQKKYDGTIKVQNRASKVHSNLYQVINSSLKYHPEYERLYIYGLVEKKEVIEKGMPNTTNSRPKTILQNILKKGMLHKKFRTFIVQSSDAINLKKQSFDGMDLVIDI